MKYFLCSVVLICLSAPALADNVTIIRDPNAEVRQLPGNAQIVTGGRDKIIIEGDKDIWRTMVFGPRNRIYAPNYNSVNNTCPPTLSVRDRNKCVRDVMKAQEKIRRKYND